MSDPNGCSIPAFFGLMALLFASLLGVVLSESDLSLADLTSSDPCTVQAERADVAVRVGPGPNRAIRDYLPANQAFAVNGKATAGDGSLWWRVTIAGVEQAWVAQDDVAALGGCALVADVDAPPIILALPTVAPPIILAPVAVESGSIDMSADVGETPLLSDNPSGTDDPVGGYICIDYTSCDDFGNCEELSECYFTTNPDDPCSDPNYGGPCGGDGGGGDGDG